jgi:AbiV family abortive infection protein
MRSRIRPRLTPEQLLEFRRACVRNADQLIEDAEVLLHAERWARAYALAHLADEELAKWSHLIAISAALWFDYPIDWRRTWKDLTAHLYKIEGATFASKAFPFAVSVGESIEPQDMPRVMLDFAIQTGTAIRKDRQSTLRQAQLREDALYVDSWEGSVIEPSAVINETMANERIAAARATLAWAQRAEENLLTYEDALKGQILGPIFEETLKKMKADTTD